MTIALVGLAVLIPLTAGHYDLSVGANVNLTAIIAVVLQTVHHWAMWPAIAVAVAAGILVGAVNAFLVVRLRVSSFIATLGMATILGAFTSIVSSNNQPLPPLSNAWNELTQRSIFGFQIVFVYLIVAGLILWWFMDHTPAGRYIRASGGNPEAARLSGVRVDKWSSVALIMSGGLCGAVGVLYASLNGPSLTFGDTLLLPAFAAAFLGSTQLKPGRFNVWGTVLAVYILATGIKGMQLITGVTWLPDMFNGVALIAAVSFAVWRQQRARAAKTIPRTTSDGSVNRPTSEELRATADGTGAESTPANTGMVTPDQTRT